MSSIINIKSIRPGHFYLEKLLVLGKMANKKLSLIIIATIVISLRLKTTLSALTKTSLERTLVLENGMVVTISSVPSSPQASATLYIAAGSMSEPPEIPGLAHFLEHMVFLGSQNNTEASSISQFIKAHGGYINAATANDYTKFYFTVEPNVLQETLIRLAEIITAPLIQESALEHEAAIVEDEFKTRLSVDTTRIRVLEASIANSDHPYSYFKAGNTDTLLKSPLKKGINVTQALMDFHHKYYSANLMTLGVVGKESLEELEKMVKNIFNIVPNRDTTLPVWTQSPYGQKQLGARVDIAPLGNVKDFELSFPIPYESVDIATNYYALLLNQVGNGSLWTYLKQKGLADNIVARGVKVFRRYAEFRITIDFVGSPYYSNYTLVVQSFFEYMKMLREKGPQEWVWQESQKLQEAGDLKKKSAKDLSDSLAYANLDYLDVNETSTVFDANKTQTLLDYFVPSNMRIIRLTSLFEYETTLVEPFYGIHYNLEMIDPKLINEWATAEANPSFDIVLPKNVFFPTNDSWTVKPKSFKETKVYRTIYETGLSSVWYIQDSIKYKPSWITFVSIDISNPIAHISPVHKALNIILFQMIKDALPRYKSQAENVGLQFDLGASNFGAQILFSGYGDLPQKLSVELFQFISSFNVTNQEELFDSTKTFIKSVLAFSKYESACSQVKVGELLSQEYWSEQDRLDILDEITLQRLAAYLEEFLLRLKIQWAFWGNTTPEEAVKIAGTCENLLVQRGTRPLISSENLFLRDVEIPLGTSWRFKGRSSSNSTTCTRILFQAPSITSRDKVLTKFLVTLIDSPAFQQLRTKEALGYGVQTKCARCENGKSVAIEIAVQGEQSPTFVEERIDIFLRTLLNMTLEEYTERREAYAAKLKTEVGLGYDLIEIKTRQYNFERNELELQNLMQTDLQEFQLFYNDLVGISHGKQRRLSIHVNSEEENLIQMRKSRQRKFQSEGQIIYDLAIWKNKLKLFPYLEY